MPVKGYRAPREQVVCAREGCGKVREVLLSDMARNKSGRFFCGADCRNLVGAKPRTLPDLECEVCGGSYRPESIQKVDSSRFCSRGCKGIGSTKERIKVRCPTCETWFPTYIGADGSALRKYCSHKCATDNRVTRGVGRKVNGRDVTTHVSGYLMVWAPGRGRMMEHRWVMERRIGRELRSDEQVHHVNNIKTDNRIANLALLSPSMHAKETRRETSGRWRAKAARIQELEDELAELRRQVSNDKE